MKDSKVRKKQALAICAQAPSRSALQAGHKLAYHFLRELSDKYIVDLVVIANKEDELDPGLKIDLKVRKLLAFKLGKFCKLYNILRYINNIPLRYCTRILSSALKCLKMMLLETHYDLIYYEFTQAAVYHYLLKTDIFSILSCHDIQTQVVLRSGYMDALFASSTYKFEEHLFNSCSEIRVLSFKDKEIMSGLFNRKDVQVVSPPITNYLSAVNRSLSRIEKYSMVFWGAMNRRENEKAVQAFLDSAFDDIVKKHPNAKIYIVGNAPSKSILRRQSDKIIVTGYVDQPNLYFERAHIGIVPLLRGAGVKIKTLEMLQAGLDVFSTRIGAEGIEDKENLFIVNFENFATAINEYFSQF